VNDIILYIIVWFSGFALGGAWLLSTDWRIYRKINEQNRAAVRAYWSVGKDINSRTAHAMFDALTKDPSP